MRAMGLLLSFAIASCAIVSYGGSALGQAQAQPSEADRLFQEAIALVQEGKLAEACPKFARSQALEPSFGALYNLADCHARAGRTASAWNEFRDAATFAESRIDGKRADKALKRAIELEPKLIHLTIEPDAPEGIAVQLDGKPLDSAMWPSFAVDPGEHRIAATAPGSRPWSKIVTVSEPGTVHVRIPALVAAGSPDKSAKPAAGAPDKPGQAAASVPAPRAAGLGAQRTGAVAVAAGGAAALVAGAVLGGLALSNWRDAQGHCDDRGACDNQANDAAARARQLSYGSTASFVVAGAAAATFFAVWFSAKPNSVRPQSAKPAAQTRVGLRVAPQAVRLRVEF